MNLSDIMLEELKDYIIEESKTIEDWLNGYNLKYNDSDIEDIKNQLKDKFDFNPDNKSSFPPIKEQLTNLGTTLFNSARKPSFFVSSEEQERRLNICRGCPHFVNNSRCMKCGCAMNWKTKLSGGKCPIKKW